METVCISHVDCQLSGSTVSLLTYMQIADCSLDAEGRLYSQCDNEVDITGTDSARFIAVCDVTYFSYDLMM